MDLRWNDTELEARFQAYVDGLAQCLGHKDREEPFRRYCTGLLLPGERKSVEPMAARLSAQSWHRGCRDVRAVCKEYRRLNL